MGPRAFDTARIFRGLHRRKLSVRLL